ncbi:hypothetical protein B447_02356 [Thauera sp. 27]|nr:hypothetical protein B447_02356 [Thauera sp. 27]
MLALVLTVLVSCTVGALLWWDAQRTVPQLKNVAPSTTTPEARSRLAPPKGENAPAVSREAAPPVNGLYRCQGPKGVLYQAEPCPGGTKQAAVEGGTMSVVSPPPVVVTQSSPPSPRDEGKSVGLITRTPAKASGKESTCEQHEQSIKQIDTAGRIGGTSWKMERLREQRRYHTDAMWRLGCGR